MIDRSRQILFHFSGVIPVRRNLGAHIQPNAQKSTFNSVRELFHTRVTILTMYKVFDILPRRLTWLLGLRTHPSRQ